MVRNLTRIGNSLGLIIERPILDMLGIDRDTPLEVTTDGKRLTIRPAVTDHRSKVRESGRRMAKIHSETFKKLAE